MWQQLSRSLQDTDPPIGGYDYDEVPSDEDNQTPERNIALSNLRAARGSTKLIQDSIAQRRLKWVSNAKFSYESLDFQDVENDLIRENRAERHRAKKRSTLRERAVRYVKIWLLLPLIGILTGTAAYLIDKGITFLTDYKWRWVGDRMETDPSDPGTVPFVTPYFLFVSLNLILCFIATLFVVFVEPLAAGSGIPEVKSYLNGIRVYRVVRLRTLIAKGVGILFSVASGLPVGKEGPMIHSGAIIGGGIATGKSSKLHFDTGLFKEYRGDRDKRLFVTAGAAAGVAAAFGAPIGGVLFSLEEASYYFPHKTMWRSFFCAVVAAIVLKRVDPSGTGRLVLFQVGYNHQWHWFELFPYALIGVIGGIVGAAFISLNVRWCGFRKGSSLKFWPVAEVCAVAVLTATLNFVVPFLHGGAGEFIARLFEDCVGTDHPVCSETAGYVVLQLLIAAAAKFLLTIFTFGIKVPAGLFIPSLFIGACLGRVVGILVQSAYEASPDSGVFSECHGMEFCIIPGVYSIVGAAAVLGGVTRMTLSLVVIIFELTGGLEYLVPVMLAVLISKWVGEGIGDADSIYERHIELNGYPYLDPKQEVAFYATAADFMVSSNIQVLTVVGWTVQDVNDLLDGCDYSGFPVVMSHSDMRIVGYISRSSLIRALEQAQEVGTPVDQATEVLFYEMNPTERTTQQNRNVLDISLALDPTPICITPDTTVNRLLHIFKSLGIRTCLVAKNNKLVGLATRKGIIQMLKRAGRSGENLRRASTVATRSVPPSRHASLPPDASHPDLNV
eukprot:TRINITY_DN71_c3_g1_i1.p1 TRINITY_DN71_c3_g1~~TRINITY_DN71_c3_g1_i1.p1  ORF type:complete len:784 (+),score=288.88 TRINITY_DN71_c3_g1_i1:69-2420(+)